MILNDACTARKTRLEKIIF